MAQLSSSNITSVFIVEDHDVVRRVLSQLIRSLPDLSLCGMAPTAEAALEQIPECNPQLVLVDVSLPGMNGIDLIRILHEKYPEMWMLALSAHEESVYASLALRAGARGYVMKGKTDSLLEAMRQVRKGDIYVSDKVQALINGRTPSSSS